MPQWIHNRAEHIRKKNPDMPKSQAFAIATQQAHKTGNTPKGYGTSEGKKNALGKYDRPKDRYQHRSTGNKRDKKKEAAVSKTLRDIQLEAFADELMKTAGAKDLFRRAAGRAGDLLAGGARQAPTKKDIRLAKKLSPGMEVKGKRPGRSLQGFKENPGEASKALAAQGAAAGGAGALAYGAKQRHDKKRKRRLGKAYMSGARDMYGRVARAHRSRYSR